MGLELVELCPAGWKSGSLFLFGFLWQWPLFGDSFSGLHVLTCDPVYPV